MNHLTKLKSRYYNKRRRKKRKKDYSSDRTSGGILYQKERKELSVSLAREKGAWNWLTVIPNEDTDNDLNKREFKDAIHLRYDWEITGKPTVFVCGARLRGDYAMICKRGGFIIQRHNELRELEADLLYLVCNDVETEPALQEITGETLRADVSKYRPEAYKSEKLKNPKKIHRVALVELLSEIYFLFRFDDYY